MEPPEKQSIPANYSTPKSTGSEALSVESAAHSGDALATLRALRDRLAVELDRCRNRRDVATSSGRLADVLAQIEAAERRHRGQLRTVASNEIVEYARSVVESAPSRSGVGDELL